MHATVGNRKRVYGVFGSAQCILPDTPARVLFAKLKQTARVNPTSRRSLISSAPGTGPIASARGHQSICTQSNWEGERRALSLSLSLKREREREGRERDREFYYPCFCQARGGWPFLPPCGDILSWLSERRWPFKRLKLEKKRHGVGAEGASAPVSREGKTPGDKACRRNRGVVRARGGSLPALQNCHFPVSLASLLRSRSFLPRSLYLYLLLSRSLNPNAIN